MNDPWQLLIFKICLEYFVISNKLFQSRERESLVECIIHYLFNLDGYGDKD